MSKCVTRVVAYKVTYLAHIKHGTWSCAFTLRTARPRHNPGESESRARAPHLAEVGVLVDARIACLALGGRCVALCETAIPVCLCHARSSYRPGRWRRRCGLRGGDRRWDGRRQALHSAPSDQHKQSSRYYFRWLRTAAHVTQQTRRIGAAVQGSAACGIGSAAVQDTWPRIAWQGRRTWLYHGFWILHS